MTDNLAARPNGGRPVTFKTFPEFSKLTFADRDEYEGLVADYPPLSDLSFATLMIWWNIMDTCAVAQLNGNLIISYWFPGIEKYSGLSIVGKSNLDESMCTIFDYLRDNGEPARLVHVPEFVIMSMRYPELFKFKEERAFDEYIVPVSRMYPLSRDVVAHRRWRLRKILAGMDEDTITMKSLELESLENKELLLATADEWWRKNTINDVSKLEREVFRSSVMDAEQLGIENVCMYIDGKLEGFCLFFLPADTAYATIIHVKVNCDTSRTLELLIYRTAKWLADRGVTYANLEYDLGLPLMRVIKLSLGPTNSFRKYTVEPVV